MEPSRLIRFQATCHDGKPDRFNFSSYKKKPISFIYLNQISRHFLIKHLDKTKNMLDFIAFPVNTSDPTVFGFQWQEERCEESLTSKREVY